MMGDGLFGFPGFYDEPNEYYEYPEFEQNYGNRYDFGHPMEGKKSNLSHRYGVPLEIPIEHEGSGIIGNGLTTDAKKSWVAEEDMSPRKEEQQSPPSPKYRQNWPNLKPYTMQHVPLNCMDASDDEELPFFSPYASSDMFEDGFPFEDRFPFGPRSSVYDPTYIDVPARTASPLLNVKSTPKVVNVPIERVVSQNSSANYRPKVINVPVERATAQNTATKKVINVPIERAVPQTTISRGAPGFITVPVKKVMPQHTAAKGPPKVVNIPVGRETPPDNGAETYRPTFNRQHSYKERQVPIGLEEVKQESHFIDEESMTKDMTQVTTSMEQLENVEEEMKAIENRIENFVGKKTDKEYILLDETVTSILLRLDMVESNGVEEIRSKRRQLVRHVQEYVQKLEGKVGIIRDMEKLNIEEREWVDTEDPVKEFDTNVNFNKEELASMETCAIYDDSKQSEFGNQDKRIDTISLGQHPTDVSKSDGIENLLSPKEDSEAGEPRETGHAKTTKDNQTSDAELVENTTKIGSAALASSPSENCVPVN